MKRNQLEKIATVLEAITILLTSVYTVIRMCTALIEKDERKKLEE